MADKSETVEDKACGRRSGTDRRLRAEQIPHSERRRGERRSGSDRREVPRL